MGLTDLGERFTLLGVVEMGLFCFDLDLEGVGDRSLEGVLGVLGVLGVGGSRRIK